MHNNTSSPLSWENNIFLFLSSPLYSLLQNLGCVLIKCTPDLTIKEFNKAAENVYRCKADEALDKNIIEFCKSINILPPIPDFSEVLSGKCLEKIEQTIPVNHYSKHLQWTIIPLFDSDKSESEVVAVLLVGLNMDLGSNFEDVQRELAYYRYIINNVPHSIFLKDKNSVFLGCNERFAKSAGLKSADDIIGKTDYDLPWSKEESAAYIEDDKQVIQSKKAKLNIEESLTVDGKQIVLLTSKVPFYNEKGQVLGVLGIFSDITERKQMEEDLRRSKEAAEAANRSKTMFLANMSHDIKTPISGIISTSEVLMHLIQDPVCKAFAEDIRLSGLRLLDFMNEIIEISKLEVDKVAQNHARFKLKQLVDDIVLLTKPAIANKPYTLDVQYDEKIPAYLVGDHFHLYRIILNLVSNAIKFTNQGGVTIELQQVSQTKNESVIKISIKDTGIGIPKDKQAIIFDQFSRLTPSYEGIYKGTGLGLYIVKVFVEAMHGQVSVESEEGKGSTFTCIIPLRKTTLQDEEFFSLKNAKEIRKKAEDELLPKGIKVLLIEDDIIAAKAGQWILQSLGCSVDVANTGGEALKLYELGKYRLIYTDLGLPDMNGMEVAQKIREKEANTKFHTPILALSAHVNNEIKTACIKAMINDVFAKPLIRDQTLQVIKEKLGFSEAEKSVTAITSSSFEDLTQAASEESLKIIDLDLAASLIPTGMEGVKETIRMLSESLPESQRDIAHAYKAKDMKKLARSVHRLINSVTYCGAMRLKNALIKLEIAAKKNHLDEIDELYHNVCKQTDFFLKLLTAIQVDIQ